MSALNGKIGEYRLHLGKLEKKLVLTQVGLRKYKLFFVIWPKHDIQWWME